ncbi:heme ABC transporter ATP-binding protein [Mangrovibacter yixingensis]|uniref:heme ABC transporter ATP-binding protein n=1 Tax=Mangrovibacter yixingensis TaxID=1529639 RepID=UPI001CFA8333|nr:heme ABC transporter ATP-binding protein [Mangrovibacter yixingensis]
MSGSLIAKNLRIQREARWLVDDISLELKPGERVALIGPNGAGKSTLLRLLTGYLPAENGELLLAGQPLSGWPAQALSRQRAVMLQHTRGLANWPVAAVVAMGRAPWGPQHEHSIVQQVLALTGCDTFANRLCGTLSGGEQQRVQLARCLAQLWHNGAPQGWLFLDEPTSALDLRYQQHLMRLLKTLTSGENLHVFTVLHDLNLAALWASRVLLMHQGKLVAQGTPEAVIQAPIINRWYGADVQVSEHPKEGTPQVFLCS